MGLQKSTKSRIPFEIVYYEEYNSKTEGIKREKQIKSYKGGVAFKNLVNRDVVPHLRDTSMGC